MNFVLRVFDASWAICTFPGKTPTSSSALAQPASRRALRAGGRVTLRLRASNPTETSASRVRACGTLPRGLRLDEAGERSRRGATRAERSGSRTRPCWDVGTLAGGRSWTVELRVRVTRSARDDQRAQATVTSPVAVATARSRATVRVAAGRGTSRARRS